MSRLSRSVDLGHKVLCVDGLPGSGKAAIHQVLQGLQRVEAGVIDYAFDFLSTTHFLGQIEDDAAQVLARILTDLKIYDIMAGRGVNFRTGDLTGVLNTHLRAVYLNRLFQPDGAATARRIRDEKPILHLLCHHLFVASGVLFRALKDRLLYVEVVRHPVYLLRHWHSYIDRYGKDVRDFTLWIDHHGTAIPWFATQFADQYIRSSPMDKVIYTIEWFHHQREKKLLSLTPAEKSCYVQVEFEQFVKDPFPFLQLICARLDTQPCSEIDTILKEQNIPRTVSNSGIPGGGMWARTYGERPVSPDSSDAAELQKLWDFAKANASTAAFKTLESVAAQHETNRGR